MVVIIKKKGKLGGTPDPLVRSAVDPAKDDPHPLLIKFVKALAREDAREQHRRWLRGTNVDE